MENRETIKKSWSGRRCLQRKAAIRFIQFPVRTALDLARLRGWIESRDPLPTTAPNEPLPVSAIKAFIKNSQAFYESVERAAFQPFETKKDAYTLRNWHVDMFRFGGWQRPTPHFLREGARTAVHYARSVAWQWRNLVDSLPGPNAGTPHTDADGGFWRNFESTAQAYGVGLLGYTAIDPKFFYNGVRLPYPNVIVLAMKMDDEKLGAAPDISAGLAAYEVYDGLGAATVRLARYLRRRGYEATAQHPYGGLAHSVPFAVKAGMGELGHHGLLITRELGDRVRLSLIFTNAAPLPEPPSRNHQWIRSFCASCNKCVRKCPVGAIYEQAVEDERTGYINPLNVRKCADYFFKNNGCAVCQAACPFTGPESYDRLEEAWKRRPERLRMPTFVEKGAFTKEFDEETFRVKQDVD